MIGIRSAISIRARGQWPLLEAVYMTAPRSVCRSTKKPLPRGGRPYMTKCSRQRMHDHRPRRGAGVSGEQRTQMLFDPGDRTPVRLLGLLELVEDGDRGHRVVAGIDHVIGPETVDVADDRNGAVLDAAGQLFRAPAFRLGLTDGGIHGILPSGCPDCGL